MCQLARRFLLFEGGVADVPRVLVVDDEEMNRDLLSRKLVRQGYEAVTAQNGPEALVAIEEQSFDIVLLDIRMPGMSGEEVLAQVRRTWSPADLPIIMVTAEADSNSVVRSLSLGADDYVTKPIDFPVLFARMEGKLVLRDLMRERATQHDGPFDQRYVESLILRGEDNTLEFKSTLRWNIHSGQVGKEIEIAWAKTIVAFLNSDGGILLIGVADDGEIIGTQLDQLKNDDKYLLHVNNTIKSLVGLEYISHIQFDLVAVKDKKVLSIQCKAYPEAVFLKNVKEDEFYARFGPSSRKLSTREVLSYLQKREH